MERSEIRTADGVCTAYTFGKHGDPEVLLYMDAVGIRPAMFEIGERLSRSGYFVMLPDLYYRAGPYEPMDARKVFSSPEQREQLRAKFTSTVSNENVMRDTGYFLAQLRGAKIGVFGYCMGGRFALVAAGTYPDRIAAAAGYHPARVATDAPDSPHLLAPQIKASVYLGRAADDANFDDAALAKLETALTEAEVDHVIETYPAKHGWVPSDTPVHDAAQTERHWHTLLALLDRKLKG